MNENKNVNGNVSKAERMLREALNELKYRGIRSAKELRVLNDPELEHCFDKAMRGFLRYLSACCREHSDNTGYTADLESEVYVKCIEHLDKVVSRGVGYIVNTYKTTRSDLILNGAFGTKKQLTLLNAKSKYAVCSLDEVFDDGDGSLFTRYDIIGNRLTASPEDIAVAKDILERSIGKMGGNAVFATLTDLFGISRSAVFAMCDEHGVYNVYDLLADELCEILCAPELRETLAAKAEKGIFTGSEHVFSNLRSRGRALTRSAAEH